ncbi:PAS domain-containing protein [Aquimarina sp. 2201CG5-10]|uniref:PAS domain-containing protein n=1 Tax=Aquimarina callyspongiae TaxID=3098150 RepID=UPI002AB59068|nr:PAS domain-containing protein [Aquimarina sp. 2201CG5-10]MDY8137849.1 PAS domain S-box protein [Aquimarina sp. 2201CG5-10]
MKALKRPTPVNEEIVLDPEQTIMSKTDPKGVIEYANDYFMEISGYEEYELIGQPHNLIRHPDMPKVIFKWLWKRLKSKENIHAVVKNLAKDGRYYWVITDFEVKLNDQGEIKSLFGRRKTPPRATIAIIKDLYQKLLSIEQAGGIEVSEKYLVGYLEEKGKTYDEFIEEICFLHKEKTNDMKDLQYYKRKGLFVRMFK